MKPFLALVFSVTFVAGALWGTTWISRHLHPQPPTLKTIEEARNEARQNHKFLMVEFGADWCSDCLELARTMREPETQPFLQNLNLVKVDVGEFNRNLEIARSLGVDVNQGIPAAVFFPPNGIPPSREVGNAQILAYLHRFVQ